MTPTPQAFRDKSWLDRTLSVFTEVRAGEGASALLLAFNVFLLLGFYSILKIIRDGLILSQGGATVASYSAAGQALLLLFVVPAYGAFASRVNRVKLIAGVTLFFASNLIIFYVLGTAGVKIGVPFYIWTGVFNVVVIAQLWGFANDVYTSERGKRLFPLINLGASLGAVVFSGGTTAVFRRVGTYQLMVVAAAGLAVSIAFTIWVDRRERSADREAGKKPEEPLAKAGGFQLVLKQRYLLLIALLIVLLNLVNTLGGTIQNALIQATAARTVAPDVPQPSNPFLIDTSEFTDEQRNAMRSETGALSGQVQFAVNLVAMLASAFVVSRILKYIGVRGGLFVLPLIGLVSYSAIAMFPILAVVRVGKIAENGTDYSLNNTVRHSLFLPTSREAKYKAKQAIDTFFWRAGDFLQAGVIFVGINYLAFDVRGFALFNVVCVLLWLTIAAAIAREHKKISPSDAVEKAA